jgi:hypothetical protein
MRSENVSDVKMRNIYLHVSEIVYDSYIKKIILVTNFSDTKDNIIDFSMRGK